MDKVNAAPDLPDNDDARDPSAASVLAGDDAAPGGGALRPQDAPRPHAAGGAAPGAPVDTGVSADGDAAERDAIAGVADRAPEPHPTSA